MSVEFFVAADESGIHENPAYCVVSGFIASPRNWVLFERRWAKTLRKYGVPDFHAKRFFARDKRGRRVDVYKNWSDGEARRFMAKLVDDIDRSFLVPVGGAVDVAAFNTLTYGERKILTGGLYATNPQGHRKWISTGAPSKPYFLALNHIVVESVQHAPANAQITFIFDQQNVLEARAVETFREIVQGKLMDGAEKITGIAFLERTKEESLQAADLVTHLWYSHFVNADSMTREERAAMDGITKRRSFMRYFNAEAFQMMLSRMPPDIRKEVSDTPAPIQPARPPRPKPTVRPEEP